VSRRVVVYSGKPHIILYAQVLLVQILLFHRWRFGEVQRILVCDYAAVDQNPVQEEILEGLSPLERKLAVMMKRIEFRGKKGRKVPLRV
jgi:hypothetical protein